MEIICEGKHLRLVKEGRWEYVVRPRASGAVCILAVTDDQKLILIEQYRAALKRKVIELPAGLVGDEEDADEDLATAADRELLEETGYQAKQLTFLTEGPPSAGLTNEIISFYLATGLSREQEGGGDQTEDITVHEVPVADAARWLEQRAKSGLAIDPKIYVGLYFWTTRAG